ncbi:hypothetical protein GGU11DRAFT_43758 [Lentinula aff. detonsa]|uniref:Uncharacterized protein n=1 Tax=Lentinula aff. detonsa TaxID=2804958 RepID=A0AA38NL94_9AGAR|nr:hypothetical protein GGU10DRAFT_359732 [Lentinula aff. detonsa]KAJ3797853.1 hypothetical protein GGU11DRAFT_43758 [Lentinula aff. detonsa]
MGSSSTMISSSIFFRLLCCISYWILEVPTIARGAQNQAATTSAPPTPVTLYEVEPSWFSFDSANARPIDGTFELDVSIGGVSSDSSGIVTTYSLGEYVSDNLVYTTTATSQGQVTTETVRTPDLVETMNWTIVESAGGAWATFSAFISSNTHELEAGEGEYQSCSFDSSGGPSASCSVVEFEPFITTVFSGSTAQETLTGLNTFTTTYGGFRTALTVLTEAAVVPSQTSSSSSSAATSASNAAGRIFLQERYCGIILCLSAVLVMGYYV